MIKFIKEKLFGNREKITKLEKQLKECGEKLAEKQEQINKTNAYYKKQIRNLKSSKKS